MVKEPKILIWDLEIIPDLTKALKHWTKLSPYHSGGKTLSPDVTSICIFGYKWLNEGRAKTICAWDFPEWETDVNADKKLCKEAGEIISGADALVYHNGDRFDKGHMLGRLLHNGLELFPKITTIDTKKVSKKFNPISSSLDHLTGEFCEERKMDHGEGWDLWEHTHNRVKKYMSLMDRYCKQDVVATENLFKRFRSQIPQIPNYNLWDMSGKNVCPLCGSTRLEGNGTRPTKTRVYKRMRCKDCGGSTQFDLGQTLLRSI